MRILVVGCRWFLDDQDVSSRDFLWLMKRAGGNTGNMFIGEAVKRHLERLLPDVEKIRFLGRWEMFHDADITPEWLDERFDAVVMAAANILDGITDYGYLAKFLEQTHLPFLILGIGAQGEDTSARISVPRGTQRLLKLAAERSRGIGVRGPFTADVVRRLGIHNIEVTGCPTMYMRSGEDARINVPAAGDISRAALHMMRDRQEYPLHQTLKTVQRQMLADCVARGFDYVVQTNFSEAWTAFHKKIEKRHLDNITAYLGPEKIPARDLEDFLLNRTHIFFRYGDWKRYMETRQFAFGARFHGNMMALMCGVPALWVTHDTRTRELCDLLHLPHVEPDEIEREGYRFDRMVEKADYSLFNKSYGEQCARFDTFFMKNFDTRP